MDINDQVRTCAMIIALEELKRLLTPLERRPLRVGGEPRCDYIHRLLHLHPDLCKEQLRLDRDIFVKLVQCIENKGLLSYGRYISIAEQIGIALYILAKGASYREVADKFQHGLATISKYFRKVLQAFITLSTEIIKLFQVLNDVPQKIANNSKYWPFFKDCVGALDGTLIEATISDEKDLPFRGRKGAKTWNVLATCSFGGIFTFVNVGFEGSAHDITVWSHCLSEPKFQFPHPPPGKYYLVDSAYPNTLGYLAPIRHEDVRYHMPEFTHGPPPQGMREHFNYRHSSLRTTIEQCFGMLKKRWKILKNMPQIGIEYQLAIMVSTFALNNFIRLHELSIPISSGVNIEPRSDTRMFNSERKAEMDNVQLTLAQEIWQSLGSNEENSDV